MYITEAPSDATALDLRTGRPLWSYRRSLPQGIVTCCGQVNRGVALLDDQVFLGTVRCPSVALDARTGRVRWDVEVAEHTEGYAITVAPLALKDKIIVGIAGGEYGIRGFLDAYDPRTGETAMALLDRSGARRARSRHLVGRQLGAGRGSDLGHRRVRPRAQSSLLGNGKPGPRLHR